MRVRRIAGIHDEEGIMIGVAVGILMAGVAMGAEQIPDVDMHAMTKDVVALQRVLFSEKEFLDSENEAVIRSSTESLEQHLQRLRKASFNNQPALRTNAFLASEQVADARRAFRSGDKFYARYALVSTLQVCIACHTRTASADFVLPEAELKEASRLEKADYLLATRQFERARELYASFLSEDQGNVSQGSVQSAATALAVVFARVKEAPKEGATQFEALARMPKFSKTQRQTFGAWAKAFREWPKDEPSYRRSWTEQTALKRARAILRRQAGNEGDQIRSLRASTFLHLALEAPGGPSPLKAEALLRLGRIYEQIQFPLYFHFGESYLKACIADYAGTKAAQRCYQALFSAVKRRLGRESPMVETGAEEIELWQWRKRAY